MTEVFARYHRAWVDHDFEAAVALWADDVVHHVAGRHRLAGTFLGTRAYLDHHRVAFAELGGTVDLVAVHDVLASPDHAVALVSMRAVRGDRSFDFDRVVVYHGDGDRITETWSLDSDPEGLAEFWG